MAKKKAFDPVGDFNFGANRKPRKAKRAQGREIHRRRRRAKGERAGLTTCRGPDAL